MNSDKVRELYLRHADAVYRTAMIYLKNRSDAEDAVSEVFLKVIRKPPVFKDETHEKAWFLRVTINYCKDLLKSAWNRRVDTGDIPEDAASDNGGYGNDILEEVLRLPPEQRELVYLYYYEGYKLREIADMTGTPESTLQSRLARARETLRLQLEETA